MQTKASFMNRRNKEVELTCLLQSEVVASSCLEIDTSDLTL